MKIRRFDWDKFNINHIARHKVEPEEVEEVFCGQFLVRKSHSKRYFVLGQTEAGRYLAIVFELKTGGVARIVTARDMDAKEKRIYRRERRN